MREKPSGSDDERGYGDSSSALAIRSDESKPFVDIEKIGDTTPIHDFEAMMSCRDNPNWVSKAIRDMKNKIYNIVENCYARDNYPKVLECLVALRKGCILEQICLFNLSGLFCLCTQSQPFIFFQNYLVSLWVSIPFAIYGQRL